MNIVRNALAAGALALSAGAASAQSSGASTGPVGIWTARFKSSQSNTPSTTGGNTVRASGDVTISRGEGRREGTFHIEIRFSIPSVGNGAVFYWGIAPGRCGSGNVPLVVPKQNQTLELGASGVAEVSVESSLNLKANESYHINIYDANLGDHDEAIISCADLKYVMK